MPIKAAALLIVALLCTPLRGSPAEPAGGEWLRPPLSFLASRLVRVESLPAQPYDVILDVPPAGSARAARPKVAVSCGDSAVDDIASDYVKTTLRETGPLAAMNKGKELRFQIRLEPLAIKIVGAVPEPSSTGGFYTPKPEYPNGARASGEEGTCTLRVKFIAGRASLVAVVKSTGNEGLDANAALNALLHWTAGGAKQNDTATFPVIYNLQRERGLF